MVKQRLPEARDSRAVLDSQYRAALRMLREAVVKCPAGAWNSSRDRDRTWMRALHAAYFADKYLQVRSSDFRVWQGHTRTNRGVPITKRELLEYLDHINEEIPERLRRADLEGPSGFGDYPGIGRFEMHLINIRHIQHHVGEIYERIGARRDPGLRWKGHLQRKTQ